MKACECKEPHERQRVVVEAMPDFLAKAARALEALKEELPPCCRRHVVPALTQHVSPGGV